MKFARVEDYKRGLSKKDVDWPFQLERLSFEDVPTLGTGEALFSSRVVLLAGPNGSGKTSLLKAIWAATNSNSLKLDASTILKLNAGTVSLEYQMTKQQYQMKATFSSGSVTTEGSFDFNVVHVDASVDVRENQKHFCSFSDIDDLVNGIGCRTLEHKDISQINYITKKNYREIKVYEVEVPSGTAAFFEVSDGNDRYDSRTMGMGELAALNLWWTIKSFQKPALFLLEEPETYLSPAVQIAISHFILESACKLKHSFVITSHSGSIVAEIPDFGHSYVYRDRGAIKFAGSPPHPLILQNIGIKFPVDTVLLVEDEVAGLMLRHILEKYNISLSRRSEIMICNGESKINEILNKVNRDDGKWLSNIAFFGVFDGDMRNKKSIPVEEEAKQDWTFLPGEVAIEIMFHRLVEKHTDAIARVLGVSDLPVILASLQGSEHHDWYTDLCRHLSLTKAQLTPSLINFWFRSEENIKSAQFLITELDRLQTLRQEGLKSPSR